MNFRWFTSPTVRIAGDMCKHVRKILNAQRDILSPQAITAVEGALQATKNAIAEGAGDEALKKQISSLETVANKWLKSYPHASIRENVEVLLVALTVAMGIRTFFLQPFKIPTGSMQPTLYGVMPGPQGPFAQSEQELKDMQKKPDLKIPGRLARLVEFWIYGNSYFNIVAPENGELQAVKAPTKFLLFNLKQEYQFNDKLYTIWFPSDDLFQRAGYIPSSDNGIVGPVHFNAGEPMLRLKVMAGDHLFVDRLTYNFRHPERGEIIVFETTGIPPLPQGQFYIKRLVALGGEKVQIGSDRHLIIDRKRLDQSTPHFDKVYSFDPAKGPQESQWSGHVDDARLAPQFARAPNGVFTVRPEHFMVMGDNTLNSYDSRGWGDFSRTNVIGKYFFVYWPFSSRFGWNVH